MALPARGNGPPRALRSPGNPPSRAPFGRDPFHQARLGPAGRGSRRQAGWCPKVPQAIHAYAPGTSRNAHRPDPARGREAAARPDPVVGNRGQRIGRHCQAPISGSGRAARRPASAAGMPNMRRIKRTLNPQVRVAALAQLSSAPPRGLLPSARSTSATPARPGCGSCELPVAGRLSAARELGLL